MIKFNKFYTHFNIISLILVILSLILLTFKGLNYGIDFKGGTLIELRSSDNNINVSNLRDNLNQMDLGDVSVKKFGNDQDYLIKFENKNDSKNIIEEIRSNLDKSFGNNFDFRRVENVGPKVSAELLKSGVIAISVSLALMLIYIWIRFEWQFSLGAIIALFHDVIITLGLFSLLSLEINLSIIAAILTIVGYSMNDTVVIFDRVRENLRKYSDIKIFELTNISINETLSRTLITSITTLLALFSIFFFGGEILKGFSLAMIFGVIFGTYSSIYIANTVLVRLNVSQKTILKEEEKINKDFELQPLLTTLVEIKVY
jgi:preprotein translocase subunit SecF